MEHIGQKRNANPKQRDHLEDPGVDGKHITLRLKKRDAMHGLD